MRAIAAFVTAGVLTLSASALGACASDTGVKAAGPARASQDWVGGDPTRLAADTAACKTESASIDPNSPDGYSDPRYGMTSAMAASIAKDNPLTDTRPQQRQAAFAACMTDKGWHEP